MGPHQHWQVRFQVLRPLGALPRPMRLCKETVTPGSVYAHSGRRRQGQTHWLLKCSLSGAGGFANATGTFTVPAGRAFLTRIADPAMRYYLPEGATGPWTFIFLAIEGLDGPLGELVAHNQGSPILPLGSGALLRRLRRYRTFDGRTVDQTPAEAIALTTGVLADLAAAIDEERRGESGGVALVDRARRRWLAALHDPPGIAGVAAELGVSRRHLGRCFQRAVGCSPQVWLQRERMALAAQWLRDPTVPVGRVADRLGYATVSHFARSFRREWGMSPGEFRRRGGVIGA